MNDLISILCILATASSHHTHHDLSYANIVITICIILASYGQKMNTRPDPYMTVFEFRCAYAASGLLSLYLIFR